MSHVRVGLKALLNHLKCALFGHDRLYYVGPKKKQFGYACWRCGKELA